jgi:hypothetical protein
MIRRLLRLSALSALIPSSVLAQHAARRAGDSAALRIEPRLLAEAAEVWRVIATPQNPIWPGWDASGTPLLLYRTGVQDVLVNHPNPPQDFAPYSGPSPFPGARIVVHDGPTIMSQPGQNTSHDVAGVRTLVVWDPEGPGDPYDEMGTIAHEAFHVFQDRMAPDKGANEMLLLRYPVLSVANNVGMAQEGTALADALRATSAATFRAAAVRWLAVRSNRRAALRPEATLYEDGVEFSEGLAKYTNLRLLEILQGTSPGAAMAGLPGFHGYDNLALERSGLIDAMLRHMRGEVNVNNAPYGTAPLRMRLYWSGMAIAAMLDRLSPDWKAAIMRPGISLTALADTAIGATPGELERAVATARQQPGYDSLLGAKTQLAERGHAQADSMVAAIYTGPGTGVIIDYAGLQTPRVALGFTPFGITVVDSTRTIFAQVPILARFPSGAQVVETAVLPLLQDTGNRLLEFRLPRELSAEEWRGALRSGSTGVTVELPGVRIDAPGATIRREGRNLRVVLR